MCLKLLLADDDRELCEELHDLLTGEGYIVDIAGDGAQGARMITAAEYDVAILDFKMPCLDGLELMDILKRRCPRTRVLLMTGKPEMERLLREKSLSPFVDGLLIKPFEPEELLRLLSELEGK